MASTRPRLGELLIAAGACSRDALREAWEQKVIYGDRLGTNLLAIGAVSEQALADVLGQQHGVHSGHGRVIHVEKNALALVPRNLAEKRFVVPHHVHERQLFLLMRDPHDAIAIDEVRFQTSLKVVPVVVCEARMWQLLEHHYRARMSLRPVPLDGPARPRLDAIEDATGTVLTGPELVSEEEFQRLYASMHNVDGVRRGLPAEEKPTFEHPPITPLPSTGAGVRAEHATVTSPPPVAAPVMSDEDTRPNAADRTSPSRPSAILAEKDPFGAGSFLAPPLTDLGAPLDWRDKIEHTNPMLARPRHLQEPTLDGEEPLPLIDLVEISETPEIQVPLVRQNTLDFHVDVAPVVDESPLSFAEASAVLKAAGDRDAIARVVLRAARTKFQRACLLTIYPDRLVGWMGIGEGMETERMRDVVMDRNERSVFGLVADSRAHYLGPLATWSAHGAWVKATGRKIPRSLAVFPLLVRSRPVALLVVENGHDQHVGSDVGEVLILAQQIAIAWESLLKPGA